MRRTVRLAAGCGITVLLFLGIGLMANTYMAEKGTSFVLESESLMGKIEEMDKILKEKAELDEDTDMVLTGMEFDLYKGIPELFITGRLKIREKEQSVDWNYIESEGSGTIHTEKTEEDLVRTGISWDTYVEVMRAANLDELVSYGGDHVGIVYMDGTTQFTDEEKQEKYSYDNMVIAKNSDGNIRKLGYYLYQDGKCIPVEDMSKMNGTYATIYISFSEKQQDASSYRGIARLGILIEQ